MSCEELVINGEKYVKASSMQMAVDGDLKYVIVRADRAGVFAGWLVDNDKDRHIVTLQSARRIWYWKGAASLSQLAMSGTSCPDECKFPEPTDRHEIHGVIEVIPCTEKARLSIQGVKVWKK